MRIVWQILFWIFVAPGVIMAILQLTSPGGGKRESAPEPTAAASLDVEADYADRLEAHLGVMESLEAGDYTSGMDLVALALAAFRAASQVVDDGAELALDEATRARREALRQAISLRQAVALPVLRDAFGPILRQQVWLDNGSARTFGPGFRTIELVAPAFAANRNIQETQQEMQGLLLEMRFTRAQYRWFAQQPEFSYYEMEPPADAEVVIWNAAGKWRPAG